MNASYLAEGCKVCFYNLHLSNLNSLCFSPPDLDLAAQLIDHLIHAEFFLLKLKHISQWVKWIKQLKTAALLNNLEETL